MNKYHPISADKEQHAVKTGTKINIDNTPRSFTLPGFSFGKDRPKAE